jgi:formate transporter
MLVFVALVGLLSLLGGITFSVPQGYSSQTSTQSGFLRQGVRPLTRYQSDERGPMQSFQESQVTSIGSSVQMPVGLALAALATRGLLRRRAGFKSPEDTYRAVVMGGDARLAMKWLDVLVMGIVTGFYIGIGGTLCTSVGGSAMGLQPGLQRFLFGAIGFPLSIFLTTVAGGQGFTPNVSVIATAFMRNGVDQKLQPARFLYSIRNLMIAFVGNSIGLVTIALLVNLAHLPCLDSCIRTAAYKVHLTWLQAFCRAVLGGWLIGLAVWTSQAAEDIISKFVTIWLCIGAYVMIGLEHCLANIFFVPAAIFAGAPITWSQFIGQNLVPTTIGNAVGGFCLLAVMYRYIFGKTCYFDQDSGSVVCKVSPEDLDKAAPDAPAVSHAAPAVSPAAPAVSPAAPKRVVQPPASAPRVSASRFIKTTEG